MTPRSCAFRVEGGPQLPQVFAFYLSQCACIVYDRQHAPRECRGPVCDPSLHQASAVVASIQDQILVFPPSAIDMFCHANILLACRHAGDSVDTLHEALLLVMLL